MFQCVSEAEISPFVVDGLAEHVHDPAEHLFADGNC